jgi:hypothetical protein
MGKVMNAASGGYQDLYKAKAYPDALHKQITGPAPDDTENTTLDLIREGPERMLRFYDIVGVRAAC